MNLERLIISEGLVPQWLRNMLEVLNTSNGYAINVMAAPMIKLL